MSEGFPAISAVMENRLEYFKTDTECRNVFGVFVPVNQVTGDVEVVHDERIFSNKTHRIM